MTNHLIVDRYINYLEILNILQSRLKQKQNNKIFIESSVNDIKISLIFNIPYYSNI